jgi:hypothetical protein
MRLWDEFVAFLADLVPGGVPTLTLASFLVTLLISLGWYFWPAWLRQNWRLRRGRSSRSGSRGPGSPRGWRFRLGKLRWRWRRRKKVKAGAEESTELSPDELPDLPAEVLLSTADQLAAAGRYKEAVRERLRAIIRDLIERGILPPTPGWTVTELAAAAGIAQPPLAPPLSGAAGVFSEIWYGLRPAVQSDDLAMRAYAEQITSALVPQPIGSPT